MKTKTEFILPLANQVIQILKEVQQFTGTGKYVFPSFMKKDKPMSDNTRIGALRRMGYTKEEFVPHSFRAMFSTIAYENMEEHRYSIEVTEALLSHKKLNKVKEVYNPTSYKKSTIELIEVYSNHSN